MMFEFADMSRKTSPAGRRSSHRDRDNSWFATLRAFVTDDAEQRGTLPDLTESQILAWADAHRERTGRWPACHSGAIPKSSGESWLAIEAALAFGLRGIRGRSTLARFLARNRERYNRLARQRLTIAQILTWADAWHRRTGSWPQRHSGTIPGSRGLDWRIVDRALRRGRCGLKRGSTLARLLAKKRGVTYRLSQPPLSERLILRWADRHHRRTGSWPNHLSGRIVGSRGESWGKVHTALYCGGRGLPGGSSLADLFARRRGARNKRNLPPFTEELIVEWADEHYRRFGCWPNSQSGIIRDAPGETWRAVEAALYKGIRGLQGGSSLTRLLVAHRGIRNRNHPPKLTIAQILAWADAFHEHTGRWPTVRSGPIMDAPGENWKIIHDALYAGKRGLLGGSSLAKLLAIERGVRNVAAQPRLTVEQILRWARALEKRSGRWTTRTSGSVADAPGEQWGLIDQSLYKGLRGLPGGNTLARLKKLRATAAHAGNNVGPHDVA